MDDLQMDRARNREDMLAICRKADEAAGETVDYTSYSDDELLDIVELVKADSSV